MFYEIGDLWSKLLTQLQRKRMRASVKSQQSILLAIFQTMDIFRKYLAPSVEVGEDAGSDVVGLFFFHIFLEWVYFVH